MEQQISYKGKKYIVKEPTIEMYKRVMALKELLTEEELYLKMLSEIIPLNSEELKDCPAEELSKVNSTILSPFNKVNKEVYFDFIHQGQKYVMIDTSKLSFGQFIDIDSFLGKDESFKMSNLEQLAAYLYIEENTKYGDKDHKTRSEAFKTLPIKYLESAIFFLRSIGAISLQYTQISLENKMSQVMMRMIIALTSIGVGIPPFPFSPKTKFGKLMKLLAYPFWLVLITLRTLLISIKKKIKKIN